MPAKLSAASALLGLSPAYGKPIVARFDGGQLSSDDGTLAQREIEHRFGIANRPAACVTNPRAPQRVTHRLTDIMSFQMLMIAAGYEDGDDAASLRHDPAFKLALGHLPQGAALCLQPTISRLENLPRPRDLRPMGCGAALPRPSPLIVTPGIATRTQPLATSAGVPGRAPTTILPPASATNLPNKARGEF